MNQFQLSKIGKGICIGLICFLFILFTANFDVRRELGEASDWIIYSKIIIPKLIFASLIGIGITQLKEQGRSERSIPIIFVCIVTIGLLQMMELYFQPERVMWLSQSTGDTRTISFPFHTSWFIGLIIALEWGFYRNDFIKMALFDTVVIIISTGIFYLPDLISSYSINDLFLVAFQIGGFFILYPILLPIWNWIWPNKQ